MEQLEIMMSYSALYDAAFLDERTRSGMTSERHCKEDKGGIDGTHDAGRWEVLVVSLSE